MIVVVFLSLSLALSCFFVICSVPPRALPPLSNAARRSQHTLQRFNHPIKLQQQHPPNIQVSIHPQSQRESPPGLRRWLSSYLNKIYFFCPLLIFSFSWICSFPSILSFSHTLSRLHLQSIGKDAFPSSHTCRSITSSHHMVVPMSSRSVTQQSAYPGHVGLLIPLAFSFSPPPPPSPPPPCIPPWSPKEKQKKRKRVSWVGNACDPEPFSCFLFNPLCFLFNSCYSGFFFF